jgi:hypothetical protein
MPDIKKVYTPAGSGAAVAKGKATPKCKSMSGATSNKPQMSDGPFAMGASNQRRLK